MADVRFEWDPKKAAANLKKHRISFEEATTVFFDENALFINDPDHSVDEQRFILMGFSNRLRMLVVSHSYSANDQVIRIISARKATRKEQRQYHKRWEQ
ncbi:BrnT family toxin [bacterium]|nr:BrnT family toxin [bacterium]